MEIDDTASGVIADYRSVQILDSRCFQAHVTSSYVAARLSAVYFAVTLIYHGEAALDTGLTKEQIYQAGHTQLFCSTQLLDRM